MLSQPARFFGVAVLILGLALLQGCGSGQKKMALTGKATFNGNPIPAGTITFDPDEKKENKGPQGRATIKDGVYKTDADFGPVSGPNIVRIEGYDGKPYNDAGGISITTGKRLFPAFQTDYDIPKDATTKDFNVTESTK